MKSPKWMFYVLWAAGIYNVLWGAWQVIAPLSMFHALNIEPPNYPELWQCVGMIVGVYGIGYIAAAFDPYRHWPIVLVGFLGKIFGPIGFAKALIDGVFPLSFGINIIFNDLIWWIPFALILLGAARAARAGTQVNVGSFEHEAKLARSSQIEASLYELSFQSPLILFFLRHRGCTFCSEMLADISRKQSEFRTRALVLVFIHMGDDQAMIEHLNRLGIENFATISDAETRLYRSIGLSRGTWRQVFGLQVWLRGVWAGLIKGYGVGRLEGDGFQMPGVFEYHLGKVTVRQIFHSVSDRVRL